MLLERNPKVIGLIAVVVLAVSTFFALQLSRGAFRGGIEVTAMFRDAAGLEPGNNIFVAGVRSGKVSSVSIEGDQAKVVFNLTAEVPIDSGARIILQNMLGKRAVLVVAGSDWDHLLAEGDVIPVSRTGTPVDIPELGDETVDLLGKSDVEALQALISSAADVTEGQREEVAALLDGVTRVSQVLSDRRDQLRRVLVGTDELVGAINDKDAELITIIDEFGEVLDDLAQRRGDLTQFMQETAATTTAVADLVDDERVQLDRILFELHEDLEIIDAHQVDIAHAFAYGGVAFKGFSEIAKAGAADNPKWANIFTSGLGPAGIDALLGCGGTVDQLLDQVLGPDPRTCEEQEADDQQPPDVAEQRRATIRSRFDRALDGGNP